LISLKKLTNRTNEKRKLTHTKRHNSRITDGTQSRFVPNGEGNGASALVEITLRTELRNQALTYIL
jgi:hypothetical protein